MGDSTGIEWTDATWNPVRGCSRVSEGCRNCYAERTAARFSGPGQPYEGLAERRGKGTGLPRWTGEVRLVPDHLADPLRWRKPRRIFVNSMSDLFHERLSNEAIAAVFGVMAAAPQHTFQILTKRARRMREWFTWAGRLNLDELREFAYRAVNGDSDAVRVARGTTWPLPNVWLGVSTEDQETYVERVRDLHFVPAAVHFISAEPLLGAIDMRANEINPAWLDWVIAGCESGPRARPCDVAWLRSLRDQCASAGVAYFLKQAMYTFGDEHSGERDAVTGGPDSHDKRSGLIGAPCLDGVQHLEFPRGRDA